jgi:hypothetical protein
VPHAAHVLALCSMRSGAGCVEVVNNLAKHKRDEPAADQPSDGCVPRDSPQSVSCNVATLHCGGRPRTRIFQFLHEKSVAKHLRLHRSADRKPITHSQPSQKGRVAICDDCMRAHVVNSKAGHI